MRTLHIYCDFWEQSVSRALNEVRKHGRYSLVVEHIHPGNISHKLNQIVSVMRENDQVFIALLHVEQLLLNKTNRMFSSQSLALRKRITISYSQYSPEIGKWAEQVGINGEINEYETSRKAPWEPKDISHGTTLQERRWIQYQLIRILISGEYPATVFEELFKRLRNSQLPDSDVVRSQRFYERDEPDMAGGSYAEVREVNPNAIDMLRERSVQVGRSGLNTLIIGETGTGKESLAWFLHDYSTRCDKPFVALNCAFFEGERLESELFGHELGAFTDAKRMKKGLVEEANGGTLFLDELPEMAPRVQAKLLRFLQDGTYTRLGGTKSMHASVRIISAAQADRMGVLRRDLYYRVADVELQTVPLRDLKQWDIVNIACNLAYRLMWRPLITENGQRILTPDVIRNIWQKLAVPEHAACLARYGWPGNMRELSTLIKRFVLLGDDIFKELQEVRLPAGYNELAGNDRWQQFLLPVSSLEDLKSRQICLKELQPAFVSHIVESLGGSENIQPTKLADALGCTYNTLKSCLQRLETVIEEAP